MNSPFNQTLARIRRIFLITALVVCPFLVAQSGLAQSVATATLLSGGLNSITISGNQSFTLTLGVTTNFVSSGYTVFYMTGANGSGLFQIVSRVENATLFNDPTTSDAVAFGGSAGILNPTNDFDLGYTGDQTNNQPAGTFTLQTITINTLNLPVGTYQIFLDPRAVMTDRTGGGFADVSMTGSPVFTIGIIPEPATVGLFVIGGAMVLVVAWRKRTARA
jgi:hypothetical protein